MVDLTLILTLIFIMPIEAPEIDPIIGSILRPNPDHNPNANLNPKFR